MGYTDVDRINEELNSLILKYDNIKNNATVDIEKINEANVRKDFIDPFFEILGWDVRNSNEYDAEKYIRGAGFSDTVIFLDGNPIIFIEAKKFGGIKTRDIRKTHNGVTIRADWTQEERQVLNYAGMVVNVNWAILTNFEKFRVFNSKTGETVLNIEDPHEYVSRINEILYFTKEHFISGESDILLTRIERPDIDLNFLEFLKDWRVKLANLVYSVKPSMELESIGNIVQRLLDRLIIIRYAEDNWILSKPDQLLASYTFWDNTRDYTKLSDALNTFFIGFDKIHNSKMFAKDIMFDEILELLDNDVLGEFINDLYNQNFRKFDANILGNTYESYLGHKLKIENNKIILIEDDNIKKSGGIYYTRPYVVEYIINNTLGYKLQTLYENAQKLSKKQDDGQMYEEFNKIRNITILDPASGSGTFLNKSYQVFVEYINKYNGLCDEINKEITKTILILRKQRKTKEAWKLESLRPSYYELNSSQILKSSIYGIDLDPQASEITSVNLMLQSLKRDEKLPLILEENIVTGNSLIQHKSDEIEKLLDVTKLIELLGNNWKNVWDTNKKPIKTNKIFPNMIDKQFSVVVGNPPYINMQSMPLEQLYCKKVYSDVYNGQNDILFYFLRNGIELLEDKGYLGFIISRYFMESFHAKNLRDYITEKTKIIKIIDFKNVQLFGKINVLTIIMILEKCTNEVERSQNNIKIIKINKWNTYNDHNELFKLLNEKDSLDNYIDNNIEIFEVSQKEILNKAWIFDNKNTSKIKEKMTDEKNSLLLGNPSYWEIGQGMQTGLNYSKIETFQNGEKKGVFILTEKEILDNQIEMEIMEKLIKGKDIKEYNIEFDNKYLLYLNNIINKNAYPNAFRYLTNYMKELTCIFMPDCSVGQLRECISQCPNRNENGKHPKGRYEWQNGRKEWYEISVQRNKHIIDKKALKIFVPSYSKNHRFGLDEGTPNQGFYGMTDTYFINQQDDNPYDVHYVLGILNSNAIRWFHKNTAKLKRDGYYEYIRGPLEKIPIPKIDFNNNVNKSYDEMISNVKRIMEYKNKIYNVKNKFNNSLSLESYKLDNFKIYYESDEYNIIKKSLIDLNKTSIITNIGCSLLNDTIRLTIKSLNEDDYKTAITMNIENIYLKYFLYYSIINYIDKNIRKKILGKSKIIDTILNIKIPRFINNNQKNINKIEMLMKPFEQHNVLYNITDFKDRIQKMSDKNDEISYSLFNLNDEDIKYIRSN